MSTSNANGVDHAPAVRDVNTTFPLVLAVATSLFCIVVPLGVPAIVFAVRARAAQVDGATDLARKRTRISVALSAFGIAAGLVVELFLVVRHMAAGFQ